MRLLAAIVACVAISGCTPNGLASASGGGGTGVTHTVDVNLTLNGPVSTPYGESGAYKPPVLYVSVGDSIVFKNSDSFPHTATLVPPKDTAGETKFPSQYPFTSAALNQTGTTISSQWSSGAIAAGATSQTILIDKPGTYLYGCFFHYGSPMRGAIVAK